MENYSKGTMNKYSVNIDNKVYQKIMHWVDKATGEVSGLGKLTINKNGVIEIKSAYLVNQKNTGSSTDLDANAVSKLVYEKRNEEGYLNFWWHSHVNMDVFWSGVDLDTIRQLGQEGFIVATVFNKKREMLSCLYRKSDDIFPETFLDELDTKIIDYIPATEIESWDNEFDAKCKIALPEFPKWTAAELSKGVNGFDYSDYNQYKKEWYSDYHHDYPQDSFEFDDQGIPLANDEAKIFSVKPQLDILCDEMLKAGSYGKARYFINQISMRINKLKLAETTAKALKKQFIDQFNQNYGKGVYSGS